MAITFLLIAFLSFLLISVQPQDIRFSLLKAILFFSLTVFGITEILGGLAILNYQNVTDCWIGLDVFLLALIIKNKAYVKLIPLSEKSIKSITLFSKLEFFLLFFIGFILLITLFIGIIYPPNNWDAMAYHMPRIIHWIQNESLAHFRTPVYPQLNSPPFAEEFILNINLLLGNDYLSNTVSWFYFAASGIVISLIAQQLGLSKKRQLLAAFVMFCLPEAILLASSTHTELVATFFMLAAIYFMIKSVEQTDKLTFLLLGISVGLATATKTTVYIYLAPFIVAWLGFLFYQKIMQKQKISYVLFLIIPLIFMFINVGHYSRNYQLSGNLFATTPAIKSYYANEEHSITALFSNVSRNLSLQFGVPKIAPLVENLTVQFHQIIGQDVNNPKTTSHTYGVDPLATHENNGANFFQMLLILLSIVVLVFFYQKEDYKIRWFALIIILSFLLFSFYLKWQPWAKLHVPFFIFYSIVIAYFMIKSNVKKWMLNLLLIGLVSSAFLALFFNYSRPIITVPPYTSSIKILDNRYDKYFSRFLNYQSDYYFVSKQIEKRNLKNIGLMLGTYELEYPLFLNSYRGHLKPLHLNAIPLTSNLLIVDSVDVIVSSKNKKEITFYGVPYKNVTPLTSKSLFMYMK